jgi:hypothetical protein
MVFVCPVVGGKGELGIKKFLTTKTLRKTKVVLQKLSGNVCGCAY